MFILIEKILFILIILFDLILYLFKILELTNRIFWFGTSRFKLFFKKNHLCLQLF